MVKLAHISDLHFGRANAAALTALTQALNEAKPDLTVITGDLTQSGRRREFAEAAAFLGTLKSRFLAVPGNHDAPVYNLGLRFFKPWARYETHIGAASIQRVNLGPVSVVGVNSARRAQPRLNWSYGRLSKSAVKAASAMAQEEKDAGRMVFLALHHPVTLGPGKAGSRIVSNGDYALREFAENGVSAILTGHVHVASAEPIAATGNRILSIQAGTAMSTRERGEQPSFGIVEAEKNKIRLVTRQFSGGAFEPGAGRTFKKIADVWRSAE
ncbi:metallophosphoesterase family protein [Hyphococcus luteus]|uniref:Metallophosphatase n=1 Tax=Hyphococcus luteus TaxID=2058213 RepID=A0A2S7KA27_9PROT|nr:metallophosphoesterase [Marinicaulis flavus]PQA89366.1 metallophosphatase [Marinicaulis flavus]